MLVFGGDIQTHAAAMARSPYAELAESYSLESMAQLLFLRFNATANVLVWVPAVFTVDHRSQFNLAIGSHCFHIAAVFDAACEQIARDAPALADAVRSAWRHRLTLVGFSAGCVVLNSLITELCTIHSDASFVDWESDKAAAALPPLELTSLLKRVNPAIPAWFRDQNGFEVVRKFFANVDRIHYVDAHRFPTAPLALERLQAYANERQTQQQQMPLPFGISIHATPRQVRDVRRTFIKREFETFATVPCCASRVYFEHEKVSLAMHFRALDEFELEPTEESDEDVEDAVDDEVVDEIAVTAS